MGEISGTYGGEDKRIQSWWGNLKETHHLQNLGTDWEYSNGS